MKIYIYFHFMLSLDHYRHTKRSFKDNVSASIPCSLRLYIAEILE